MTAEVVSKIYFDDISGSLCITGADSIHFATK